MAQAHRSMGIAGYFGGKTAVSLCAYAVVGSVASKGTRRWRSLDGVASVPTSYPRNAIFCPHA